jgi:hypothetical protein
VALADVRKSINFCKMVEMPIVGVVENMSGFVCPHCSKTVDIFSTGGGEQTARDFDLPFLGRVPMDPRVVMAGDTGIPYLSSDEESPAIKAFDTVVCAIEQRLPPGPVAVNPFPTISCACGPVSCGSK